MQKSSRFRGAPGAGSQNIRTHRLKGLLSAVKRWIARLLYSSPPARAIEKSNRVSREAFVLYMMENCAKLGMTNTRFSDASGLSRDSVSCAIDELKMALAAAGDPRAMDLWSSQSSSYQIGGRHRRTVHVTSNVFSDWLEETSYRRLGGKGGTFSAGYAGCARKAVCAIHAVCGVPVALAVMGQGDWITDNIVPCTRELCGMMATRLSGSEALEGEYLTLLTESGGGYAAVPVPNCPGAYGSRDAGEIPERDLALMHNETAAHIPASTTKTMTMLCALSLCSDLQKSIRLVPSDIRNGSGSAYYPGDRLSMEDALRIMMTESSNTMAEAVSRVVGRKLRNRRAKK